MRVRALNECVLVCPGLRCHFSVATHPYPRKTHLPFWECIPNYFSSLENVNGTLLFTQILFGNLIFSPQSCSLLHTNLMRASERHALLDSLQGDREQQSRGKSISKTVTELETKLTASLLFSICSFLLSLIVGSWKKFMKAPQICD